MLNLTSKIDIKQLIFELRSRKDITFTIIVLIASLFFSGTINKNLSAKAALLRQEIEKQKKINSSSVVLKELQDKFTDYQKSMPEEINAYTALEKINKIAAENDVRLVSVAPGETKDKSVYVEHPLNIKLEGYYPQLAGFVTKIEGFKFFKILDLDLSPQVGYGQAAEYTSRPKLLANISLLAISLKR